MNYTHTHKLNCTFKKPINTTTLEQCFSAFLFSRKALQGRLPFLGLSPLFPLVTHTTFFLIFEQSSQWGPFLQNGAEVASYNSAGKPQTSSKLFMGLKLGP